MIMFNIGLAIFMVLGAYTLGRRSYRKDVDDNA